MLAIEGSSGGVACRLALSFFLIAATSPMWGAIAIDQVKSTNSSSPASSITSPSFSTTSANELLLAFISTDATSSGITVTGVTGGGITWALVRRTNAQLGTAEIWRAFAPTTLTNVTVTAATSQNVASSITVVTLTGTDTSGTGGSGAIGATGSGNANPGAPTASLVTTRNGSWVLGVGNDWDNATGRTPGNNQTVLQQYLATVGDTYWVQQQNAPTPLSGTTVAINDTAPTTDRYNLSVVEVLPGIAGADLTVSKTHSGSFIQGQTGASYAIVVTNVGGAPTTGTVTVADTLPLGMTATAMNGSGWTCNVNSLSCTRSDALATGSSYPSITLKVNVANNAPSTVTNFVTVSGGGEANTSNDSANDVTTIASSGGTYSISGTVSPPASGYQVVLTASSTATTTTDASGGYSFAGLGSGSYTVTPSQTGFAFTPPYQNVAINTGNISGIDFTVQPISTTALAIDGIVSKDNGTAASTITSPAFSTAFANELLLALVATDSISSNSNMTVSSVTGAGLTWNLVRRTNSNRGTSEIWRAFATNGLSNATVAAKLSQSVVGSMTVLSFSGVDPSQPVGATGSGSAASGAPTASLTTTRNNSWVVGVGNDFDKAIARTIPSDQTAIHQYLALAVKNTYWMQRQNATTPASGTVVSINDTAPTSDRYNLTIAEVLPFATVNVAVSISPTAASLSTGGQQQFTAYVSGTVNTAVTWSASGGTVTNSGLYTAPGTAGTYTVTATSAADTTKFASASVTVTQGSQVSISVTPSSADVQAAGQQQFTATVSGTTNSAVTWSASGGTVTTGGLYTAPGTAGSYLVTATSVADTTKSASATVNVTPPGSSTVLLGDQNVESHADSTLALGQALAFQATANANANLQSLAIYLDSTSTVSRVVVGLYSDAGGHPGSLLSQGSNTQTVPGAWNPISMVATSVTAGMPYWIAILGTTGGTMVFRDAIGGVCASETSSQNSLTSLPSTWTAGTVSSTCPVSAFGDSTKVVFFDTFAGTKLSSNWTVISRHGEYSQNETECNIPQQVTVANGLTITTAAQTWTCGDFNIDGTVWHTPSAWPYVTGDIQWTSLNFTYGTVEIRAKFPDQATGLWPATWLLGSNCQGTNPYTGETGVGTCPNLGSSGYTEIDMTECYGSGWCQFHIANPGFGVCDATSSVDTNFHTFRTVWNSSGITQYMDGVALVTCNQKMSNPMFLIIQTQTGGVGGTPNNAILPANLAVDYVKVTQP